MSKLKLSTMVYITYLLFVFFYFFLIVRSYKCGAKGSGVPGPFHIQLKAFVEEEEMFEDKRRESRLPRYIAEDNLVLGKPKSWKGKAQRHQGQSPRTSQRKSQA